MGRECYMDTVLAWIRENPDCSARQIANGTSLKVHQTSNALRTLVKKGAFYATNAMANALTELGKILSLEEAECLMILMI